MKNTSVLHKLAKRTMDIAGALVGLILCMPIFLIVPIVIKLVSRGPVFFLQKRAGLGGKPFHIIKFHTLTTQRDASGELLPDEQRMTRWGQFLRRWNIDELPEFLNILIGNMSLVGPRPLPVRYLDRYSPAQARRHEAVPGITGWAQINGRNAISWDEKFRLDVWYVDNWSVWLDIKILFLTFLSVFKGTGISADGHATMPEFTGSQDETDE